MTARREVLVVNLGTAAAATPRAVRAFLAEFLADRRVVDLPRWLWMPILHGIVLRARPRRVARQYAAIWTDKGSPLEAGTTRIARSLEKALGGEARVTLAYRYGVPNLAAVLRRLLAGDAASVDSATLDPAPLLVVPLFPQPTGPATGTIEALAREAAGGSPRVRLHLPDPAGAGYVEALASRCRDAFQAAGGPPDHLVVSFHGIPRRYDRAEGGVYPRACARTTRALLDALGWDPARATMAYQSRFGPERWLEPATAAVLEDLPRRGARAIAVVCPGFLTEGLETLEEIGIRGRETFRRAGGSRFTLVPAVEDHPAFVAGLAREIRASP